MFLSKSELYFLIKWLFSEKNIGAFYNKNKQKKTSEIKNQNSPKKILSPLKRHRKSFNCRLCSTLEQVLSIFRLACIHKSISSLHGRLGSLCQTWMLWNRSWKGFRAKGHKISTSALTSLFPYKLVAVSRQKPCLCKKGTEFTSLQVIYVNIWEEKCFVPIRTGSIARWSERQAPILQLQ